MGPILAGIVALLGIGTVGVVAARSHARGPHLVPIGGQLPALAALAALAGAIAVLLLARRIQRRRRMERGWRTGSDRPTPAHGAGSRGLSTGDLESLLTRARPARPRRRMRTETRMGGANWVRRLDDRIPVLSMGSPPGDPSADPTPPPARPEDEPKPLARG